MIKNDFYTTAGTTSYDFDVTSPLMSLTDITTDMGNQYLMGYCTSDRLPECATPVHLDGNGSQTVRLYSDYSKNYGYGFAVWGYTRGEAPGALYYLDDNDAIVRSWGIDYDYSFINRGEMCRVCANPSVSLYIQCNYIREDLFDGFKSDRFLRGGSAECGGIRGVGGRVTFSFGDFCDMIKNDTPIINATGTAQGQTFTVTAKPSDFGDHTDPDSRHFVVYNAGNGYYVRIEIQSYYIQNTPVYYNNTQYDANIVPFYQIDVDKKSICVPGTLNSPDIKIAYNGNIITVSPGSSTGTGNSVYDPIRKIFYGGFNHGTLDISDIDFTNNTSTRNSLFYGNYHLVCLATNTNIVATACFTPIGIYNHVCMFHKHTATPSDTYSTNDIVTVFSYDEVPTTDTVSGTLSEIAAHLRPWQLPNVDIASNTFTPEDIPVPEPEDADSSGDDITDTDFSTAIIGAANNFVTLYALSSDCLSDIGKHLWAKLSDPNYWQTVGTVFSNDYSINPADILRYFLAVRYFPFDLFNESHVTTGGVYIGRAVEPIPMSYGIPFPIRLRKCVAQLDGGYVTIPRKYNDFRDYEPCTTVQLTIPFCGSVEIPASEVMGKTLHITYKVDLQTGAMLSVVSVASNTNYVIATAAGSCGASIPITANNNIEFLQRIATVTEHGITGGLNGARRGAFAAGELGAVTGAVIGTTVGQVSALAGLPPVSVHKQGNASGFANLGGVACAYVTIQRQRYEVPSNYGHTSGYACDISDTIGNLTGYVVCSNVDTTSIPGFTANEVAEIKRLLESGVYV